MIRNGTITEGMIPKINTCLDAVKNGYKTTVIQSLTAPVSIETAETASTELDKAGVEII